MVVAFAWRLVRELKQRAVTQTNLDGAMSQMSQGLSMFDENLRLVVCNDKYLEMYSLPKQTVGPGCSIHEILQIRKDAGNFSGEIGPFVNDLVQRLARGERVSNVSTMTDGKLLLAKNCAREGGGWVATHDDITERQRAENELSTIKTFLDSVIENIPAPVAVKDPHSRKFVLVNRAYESLLGTAREDIIGTTAFDQFDDKVATEITSFDWEALNNPNKAVSGEFTLDTKRRGPRVVTTTRIVVRNMKHMPQYLIVVIDDITDRKNAEAKISHLAHYDSITGLANRSLFRERIDSCLAATKRYGSEFAVLLLDLDRFKGVNDTLGHQAGDTLLREVAVRLNGAIREVDFAARLGGDEFALIVAPGNGSLREGVATLATRLHSIISAPYEVFGTTISIGVSIGIALAPNDASSADDLMKFADLAMYQAKKEGRNDYRFFVSEMNQEAQARRDLEGELRSALANDEFELFYQPVVDAKSGVEISAEALIRWHHPKRGLLTPDQFIPCAEESGLIIPLGEWVLRRACAEATTWPAAIKVAVNLSAVQCQKGDLGDIVIFALAESGLAPERLELEFTESVLLNDTASNLATFHLLRELGVSIIMDDFGTGFSSLRYLQQFPFDKIKIDRSFICNLLQDQSSAAIICAVNALAKGLNMVTVAEGIETPEQYDLLRLAGCDQMQGFLFGSPVPPSQLKFKQALYPVRAIAAA